MHIEQVYGSFLVSILLPQVFIKKDFFYGVIFLLNFFDLRLFIFSKTRYKAYDLFLFSFLFFSFKILSGYFIFFF